MNGWSSFAVLWALALPAASPGGADLPPGAPAPALSHVTSLPEGLQRARAENRLVMVDFWRDACLFCVRMDRETFADPRVIKLLGDYVVVRAKNTDHPAEIERYGVDGYPTLAVLDPEGKAIDVYTGYLDPGQFSSWLATAAERHRRMLALEGRIARDPGDLEALLALGRLYSGDGKREEARKRLEEVLRADPQGKRRETAEAHLEIGLTWRRSREYRRAVESLSRAREIAMARMEGLPEKKAPPEGGDRTKADPKGGPIGDGDLLDRALYELASAQLLAGQREGLLKTLEEYDARVRTPDARRHAWVLLQLGQTSLKNGEREKARRAFERCDELYTRSSEARECREALGALR